MSCRFYFLGLIFLSGCESAPESTIPKFDPSGAAKKAIELFDTNKNGTIEGAELDKCPGLKAALAQIDTNHDQALSQDEIKVRIQSYVKDGVAVQPVNISFQLDGRPLNGVTVSLVPEPFLELTLKRAKGTTDSFGTVSPITEGLSLPAVNLGLYRVEIVGKNAQGQDLPAKFNTETTLGVEVALDVPSFERGINFVLTSK